MAKPTFERVPDFVPVSLRYAYLSTEILVSLDGEWQPIMQLPELDAGSVIVLTAHNPRSQRLSDSDNQERNDALAAQLAESGHEVRPAEAFDLHSDWSESSFVVVGLSHKAARRLCREYGQFAYFEINADAVIVHGGFSRWSLARPHGHDPLPRRPHIQPGGRPHERTQDQGQPQAVSIPGLGARWPVRRVVPRV